ncbi:hypothetical protein AAU61_10165 [Desulfocarbo indianensis]|nr:hypothetical protein AAU61_10165 [Desulfocarbo indianensis]
MDFGTCTEPVGGNLPGKEAPSEAFPRCRNAALARHSGVRVSFPPRREDWHKWPEDKAKKRNTPATRKKGAMI